MRKPILSAPISRLAAALVAGTLASTALVPLAHAQKPKKTHVKKAEAKKSKAKKPDKKTRDEARKAYGAAEKAYGAGKYSDAYDGFKKANDLIPSPFSEYWMAMSLDKEGKSADAYAAFKTFLADPHASKVGADKMSSANDAFNKLKSTPAEVDFKTAPVAATISVDGQAQMGETPMTVKIPPGDHKIEVSAPGYETQKMNLTVAPGEKQEQAVTLEASATPPAATAPAPAAAPAAPAPAPTPPPAPPPKKSMVPAYVTLGIAGAGLIVGGIFGVKALGDKSTFNKTPTNSHADTTERDALIADMAFGVAITLGVTGVVLLTSGSGDSGKQSGQLEKLPPKATLNVAPYVSPHGGGAAARLTF